MHQKIGVLGGSFNPVHNGHLIVAQSLIDDLGFDSILFIPNGHNPFKDNQSSEARKACLEMLNAAIYDNPNFFIDRSEIDHEGKKFTYNTMKSLKEQNPDSEFYFIIGSDLINDLDKWYKIDQLLKIANFIVIGRAGYKDSIKKIKDLNDRYGVNIQFHRIPEIEISSTGIRNRVKLDKSIRYFVPEKVGDIIKKKELYQYNPQVIELLKNAQSYLKKNLKPKRYEHSLNVMKTAALLAERFDVSVEKALVAGLLHDIAKSFSQEEMVEYAKKNNLNIPNEFFENPSTLHAPIGAALAKDIFQIEDQNILSAIAKHTTGGSEMSKLDKVIFLADYIEPSRHQPGVQEIRDLSQLDLNQAVLKTLENTIDYLSKAKQMINPSSLRALAFIKNEVENG